MSKYVIEGHVISAVPNGNLVQIVLKPLAAYTTTCVRLPNYEMAIFRPVDDDGRAEIAFIDKAMQLDVAAHNGFLANLLSNMAKKKTWRFEFAPSTSKGDTTIWVMKLGVKGRLLRKSLNPRIQGLRILSIV